MDRVITFGEIMLRLTTPGFQRFGQACHLDITYGGAEANVAVAIAQLGGSAAYITKLPTNEIADRAVQQLRGLEVDVKGIVRGGDRIGVYFLEQGASQRGGKVIYDRANSAFALASPSEFDWEQILDGANWFHWSGISPALSSNAAEITRQACEAAKQKGLTVSFDLNYRSKLWDQKAAGETLAPLMQYVDICITSAEEARYVFGLNFRESSEAVDIRAAEALIEEFKFKTVALTQRKASKAGATEWGAMLFRQGQASFSARYQIDIVDRVGAGDSFSGALIFALQRGNDLQASVDFAVAASSLKHTIVGDYNLVSLEEVEALVGGAGGGRVQR